MAGSPGSGKTLLARALPGVLPEMSIEESLDVTRIYSVADQLPAGTPLIRHRPLRAPHHTVSHAGLVGGGNIPKPGEISLAHRTHPDKRFLLKAPDYRGILCRGSNVAQDIVIVVDAAAAQQRFLTVDEQALIAPFRQADADIFGHFIHNLAVFLEGHLATI